MQQPQAVLGEQYCSKYPRAYTVQPTNWGWSGGDAKILDEQGALAFSVDARAWAIKCDRVLADAAGNPVCAMQAKVWSMKSLWKIHRGASMDDSTVAATITRDAWSFRRGLEAKISGSQASDFTLRAKKIMAFRNQEYEILYRGSAIGQAVYMRTGNSRFSHGYKVNLEAGYDHAFLLCMILILHAYRQSDGVVCANSASASAGAAAVV